MGATTRILAVANQKGGVGKTTTCVNLAAALVEQGKKVLLLDNDPQANLTSYLGAGGEEGETAKATLDELYLAKRQPTYDEAKDRFILSHTINLDYIASDKALAGVEYYLYSRQDRETALKQNLWWTVGEYDFVIIDNPPSLNLLTLNALVAATGVIVPVQTEFFSLEGIVKMQETIAMIRERWNPELRIEGILPTQVDGRKKLSAEVLSLLQQNFPETLLSTRIRENSKLAESSGHGKTILRYAPNSLGAEDYRSLAQEVSTR